jgi:two-component system, sensor histidine kinase
MLTEDFRFLSAHTKGALPFVVILLVYGFALGLATHDLADFMLNFVLTILVVTAFAIVFARRKRQLMISSVQLIAAASAARRIAEETSLAKSRFIATASHNLRQPVHAQSLFLSMLASMPLSTGQSEIVANLEVTSNDSGNMLDALIDFSRIEAGMITPHIEPFRLQRLFNKLEREFAPHANVKGVLYHTRDTNLMVKSDSELIEKILRNLISNAVLYTDGGWLLVAARKRGSKAVLEVWDTGCGIESANQHGVFQDYKLLGSPQRDGRKGLGLGLAISAGLAAVLGHELILSSSSRRGSVFRLTLPMADGVLAVEDVPTEPMVRQTFNVRALVIEDDASVRSYMQDQLSHWGCRCDAAESVDEALALARANRPHFLVSDYHLKGPRSGIEAIVAVRGLLASNIPALLITGDTSPELVRETLSNKIYLLHKPLSADELHSGLMKMLKAVG